MQLVPVTPKVAFAQAEWEALSDVERGARILAAINEHRSSKSELAKQLNVTFQSINAWVMGDSRADWARWMAVCYALGIDQLWAPPKAALEQAQSEIEAQLKERKPKPKRKARPH